MGGRRTHDRSDAGAGPGPLRGGVLPGASLSSRGVPCVLPGGARRWAVGTVLCLNPGQSARRGLESDCRTAESRGSCRDQRLVSRLCPRFRHREPLNRSTRHDPCPPSTAGQDPHDPRARSAVRSTRPCLLTPSALRPNRPQRAQTRRRGRRRRGGRQWLLVAGAGPSSPAKCLEGCLRLPGAANSLERGLQRQRGRPHPPSTTLGITNPGPATRG